MSTTIRAADIAPVPWKNGGGTARELARAADGRWRVSLADIERDGPFSDYPGVERWFAVVQGEGVELTFPDRTHELRVGDPPLVFEGRPAPYCRLLDGPTKDLNLLLEAGTRGTLRRAGPAVAWTEDWPLRGHFDFATLTLTWGLPPGPVHAAGVGVWIGIAP